jgi:hypothetical protein
MTGWQPVSVHEAQILERELARELPEGHALKQIEVRVVARRLDRDDVACELGDGRLCVVHLTWNVETDPRWPRSEVVSVLP